MATLDSSNLWRIAGPGALTGFREEMECGRGGCARGSVAQSSDGRSPDRNPLVRLDAEVLLTVR